MDNRLNLPYNAMRRFLLFLFNCMFIFSGIGAAQPGVHQVLDARNRSEIPFATIKLDNRGRGHYWRFAWKIQSGRKGL